MGSIGARDRTPQAKISPHPDCGKFGSRTIRTLDYSYYRWTVRTIQGTKSPGTLIVCRCTTAFSFIDRRSLVVLSTTFSPSQQSKTYFSDGNFVNLVSQRSVGREAVVKLQRRLRNACRLDDVFALTRWRDADLETEDARPGKCRTIAIRLATAWRPQMLGPPPGILRPERSASEQLSNYKA